VFEGGEFDLASPVEDALAGSEVDIRLGEVVEHPVTGGTGACMRPTGSLRWHVLFLGADYHITKIRGRANQGFVDITALALDVAISGRFWD
jgi:hypothetical protein